MNQVFQPIPLHILVVEDNAGDFLLLQETIIMSALPVAEIQLVESLSAATEYLKQAKPDIIFLDLFLPDSSGLDSFNRLKEYTADSAVIILSGLSDTKAAREAIIQGAQDFLAKGEFDEKMLEKTMIYSIERKRSMVKLREANERYNLVSKATHDLIWDWDLETGQIYREEEAVKTVYGLSSNSSILDIDSWRKRIHPEDMARVVGTVDDIKRLTIQDSFEIEYRFLSEAGTYKDIYDKGYVVRNSEGKPIRLIGAAQDITERKKNEAALAQQQALFRVLVERSPDMKALITPGGEILYSTPAITSILGYSENEYTGSNEKELIHPNDVDALFNEINKTISDPEYISRIQVRVLHKEGHYLWCDKTITNLLNDPYVNAIVCNSWDITKEKEAEEKIRLSEEKYRQIFNDNPFPMILYTFDTLQILECNNATLQKYGYTREEFLQLTILDIRPENDVELVKSMVTDPGKEKQLGERIWRHLKKNGEEMQVEVFVNTIEYGGKKVKQVQINDITEKLKLGIALEESRIRQQKAVTEATIEGQEKERVQLGIELHDNINQILATAKLYLDFAMSASPVKKDAILKSKEFIMLATDEIRKLSHALLPSTLEEFGLITALDELLAPLSITGNFFVDKQWDTFQEKCLPKDQKLTIYRIVQEQLNNIIKHAGAKIVIASLRLMDDGQSIELVIKDDGKGFDPSQKKNGVGLRNIISRAGLFDGSVTIKAKSGKGCELKVIFPGKQSINKSFSSN